MVYPPSDDTYLVIDSLPVDMNELSFLEVGAGSGLISQAAKERGAHPVLAIDISEEAARATGSRGVDSIVGDLLTPLSPSAKFDLIAFNPPYLPFDGKASLEVVGGNQGWEISYRFALMSRDHLKDDGKILLLTSSVSSEPLMRSLASMGFAVREIAAKALFFEVLKVVELTAKNRASEVLSGSALNPAGASQGWP